MKKIVGAVAQFVVFLVCFAGGSFGAPLHIRQVLGVTPDGTRVFLWDGVILMVLVLVAILAVEATRRRLASLAGWTVAAFVLAAAVGFALRLGFLTI